jgi:hypothetical protein
MNREQARKQYLKMVTDRAKQIALKQDSCLVAKTNHLAYALLEQLSEAFLVNQELVAEVSNLRADMEALRRAMNGDLNGSRTNTG